MKLRALVIAAASIQRLLRHLGEPADPPVLAPARGRPSSRVAPCAAGSVSSRRPLPTPRCSMAGRPTRALECPRVPVTRHLGGDHPTGPSPRSPSAVVTATSTTDAILPSLATGPRVFLMFRQFGDP
jgi:hypothetical protein